MKTTIHTHATPTAISHAARAIREGHVAVIPTETVYGMAADATNPMAVASIFRAKGRPSDNPLIVHLADAEDTEKYAYTSPLFWRLAEAFMPGPLTIVLPKRDIIPDIVSGGLSTVAIRVPVHPVAREIIRVAGVPIAAPSANISGRPSSTRPQHIIDDCCGKVSVIVCDGASEIGLESTVVALDGDGIVILRPGEVTLEMLRTVSDDVRFAEHNPDVAPISPGTKYKHYAPRATLILVRGNSDKVATFLQEKSQLDRVGILDSCEADTLFAELRNFDEQSDIHTIYAPYPTEIALENRLLKAAQGNILEI